VLLSINGAFIALYVSNALSNVPVKITSFRDPLADFNSTDNQFITGLNTTDILSFFVIWIGTVFMLHHHSKRIGKVKYWIMVSIPLIYFLGQFQSVFLNVLDEFSITQPFLFGFVFTIVFNSTNTVGGVLFGIAFWTMAKSVNKRSIKSDMVVAAIGITLVFSSTHSALGLGSAPYPPFGLASVWFVGLASYLWLVGIYSSALSVVHDTELRQTIRKSVERQSDLLHSIGTSEMEYQIQKNVLNVVKRVSITEELQPSLEEEDVKQYIDEVIRQVKQKKYDQPN
jgi:hypothetical protein